MWPFLVMTPDIFSKDISNLCFIKENKPIKGSSYCVKNLGKQLIFLLPFSRWGED